MSKLQEYLAQKGLIIDEARVAARLSILDYLIKARDSNKAYLAISSPTASERNDQIIKLTRQAIRMQKLLLNDMTEDEEGTC